MKAHFHTVNLEALKVVFPPRFSPPEAVDCENAFYPEKVKNNFGWIYCRKVRALLQNANTLSVLRYTSVFSTVLISYQVPNMKIKFLLLRGRMV